MPIYRAGDKILHFSHVPKCAGTSITEYLSARFGPAALEDRAYRRDPQRVPWNLSSPQHIRAEHLQRFLPDTFIDMSFAIVRDPFARIQSVYHFQKYGEKSIPRGVSFKIWLRTLRWQLRHRPFAYDNHIRPQVEFLLPQTQIFKLENGFEPVISMLDEAFGPSSSDITVGHEKKRKSSQRKMAKGDAELIREIYKDDFRLFDYSHLD